MQLIGWVLVLAIWAGILIPPVLAVYGLLKWHGGWKLAALVPMALLLAFFGALAMRGETVTAVLDKWIAAFSPFALVLALYAALLLVLHRRSETPGRHYI